MVPLCRMGQGFSRPAWEGLSKGLSYPPPPPRRWSFFLSVRARSSVDYRFKVIIPLISSCITIWNNTFLFLDASWSILLTFILLINNHNSWDMNDLPLVNCPLCFMINLRSMFVMRLLGCRLHLVFSSPRHLMVSTGCIIVLEIAYQMDFSLLGFLVCSVILGFGEFWGLILCIHDWILKLLSQLYCYDSWKTFSLSCPEYFISKMSIVILF